MLTAAHSTAGPLHFLRAALLLLALPLLGAWSLWGEDSGEPEQTAAEALAPNSPLYQKCARLAVKADEQAPAAADKRLPQLLTPSREQRTKLTSHNLRNYTL